MQGPEITEKTFRNNLTSRNWRNLLRDTRIVMSSEQYDVLTPKLIESISVGMRRTGQFELLVQFYEDIALHPDETYPGRVMEAAFARMHTWYYDLDMQGRRAFLFRALPPLAILNRLHTPRGGEPPWVSDLDTFVRSAHFALRARSKHETGLISNLCLIADRQMNSEAYVFYGVFGSKAAVASQFKLCHALRDFSGIRHMHELLGGIAAGAERDSTVVRQLADLEDKMATNGIEPHPPRIKSSGGYTVRVDSRARVGLNA